MFTIHPLAVAQPPCAGTPSATRALSHQWIDTGDRMTLFSLPLIAADAMLEVWLAGLSALQLTRGDPVKFMMDDSSAHPAMAAREND
jgi:hypothetical protein